MITNYSSRVADPTAFVTRGRQRVKQYGQTVYLKNGDEFELELFNPTQSKVLAKIKINGKYISTSGIVLRPGERVFLERYLDEAKKFLFETYEVNGADPNVQQAIRNNGDVEIEFYSEYTPVQVTYYGSPSWINPNVLYRSTTGSPVIGDSYTTSSKSFSPSDLQSYCCNNTANVNPTLDFAPVETGRVEKGNDSEQRFNHDSTQFNSYWMAKSIWKILPDSQRPLVKEDLATYCTKCGAKRKKSTHIFCPTCGNKF